MSNYQLIARDRITDEEFTVVAMDDYFGRHHYGYAIGEQILTEEQFHLAYEPVVSSPHNRTED